MIQSELIQQLLKTKQIFKRKQQNSIINSRSYAANSGPCLHYLGDQLCIFKTQRVPNGVGSYAADLAIIKKLHSQIQIWVIQIKTLMPNRFLKTTSTLTCIFKQTLCSENQTHTFISWRVILTTITDMKSRLKIQAWTIIKLDKYSTVLNKTSEQTTSLCCHDNKLNRELPNNIWIFSIRKLISHNLK